PWYSKNTTLKFLDLRGTCHTHRLPDFESTTKIQSRVRQVNKSLQVVLLPCPPRDHQQDPSCTLVLQQNDPIFFDFPTFLSKTSTLRFITKNMDEFQENFLQNWEFFSNLKELEWMYVKPHSPLPGTKFPHLTQLSLYQI